MVKAMSMQVVGRQIDGIWHTSVVVFNKEIFFGPGIVITTPGQSHHGQPLQVIDMGETALDEEIFEEYLAEMRDHYTADKVHLPSDFLSTPFGAALRPTIDAMFSPPRGPTGATRPSQAQQPITTPSTSLLQSLSNRATGSSLAGSAPDSGYSTPSTSGASGPIHPSTNPSSFRSLLSTHRGVVAMFTSATCPPCRMIEPVFEDLARSKKNGQIAFVKVDLGVGMGSMVAREYGVTATPTFGFFLDGKKIHELKGVNAPELRTQVDLLLYQAFPPHPHVSLDLPSISSVSTEPILFTQVPALDTVHDKLVPAVVAAFGRTIAALVADLPAASMFPLFDIWRLAILEPAIAQVTLTPLVKVLTLNSESVSSSPRATLLTLLRLATNAIGASLSRSLLLPGAQGARAALTSVLVQTLLHQDRLVRVAAASLAFNVGAWVQKGRVARIKGEEVVDGIREGEEDGEWEVELVSAVAEALAGEEESEDAVHRLTATLGFLIRLSPFYEDQLVPLLGVLQVGETLKGKLAEDGKLKVRKKEIRALVEEVADRLCSST
ncbi:PUL domain-containing protein [Russula aff. rugulosa BPL654]|nr:PUL domain-containing protein [Russula aff. rugulosa BPL654]